MPRGTLKYKRIARWKSKARLAPATQPSIDQVERQIDERIGPQFKALLRRDGLEATLEQLRFAMEGLIAKGGLQ